MDSPSSSRPRRADPLEEGEFVPGHHSAASDDTDDDERYSLQNRREGRAAMLPLPTPSYECYESDGTISDDDGPASLSAGKRGSTDGSKDKAAVSSRDELNHSTATARLAFARSNRSSSLSMASARTNLDSGETSSPHSIHNERVPAAGANPSNEAFVDQKPAPPPQEAQQAHQLVLQLALAVPPVQGPAAPRREYTCKICGKSYWTHQGLGGHAAGHKNRQKAAEAAAAQDGGLIPAAAQLGARKEHECNKCGKAFPTGVALGGHKRKHYNGPPIVHRKSKKRCVAPPPPVAPPPALAPPAAAAMADALRINAGQPSVSPAATGFRLRLFGIDIGPPPAEAPVVQEGTDIVRPQAEAPVAQEGTDIKPHEEAPQEGRSGMAEG